MISEKVSDYVTQIRKTNTKYLELQSNMCDLKIIRKHIKRYSKLYTKCETYMLDLMTRWNNLSTVFFWLSGVDIYSLSAYYIENRLQLTIKSALFSSTINILLSSFVIIPIWHEMMCFDNTFVANQLVVENPVPHWLIKENQQSLLNNLIPNNKF